MSEDSLQRTRIREIRRFLDSRPNDDFLTEYSRLIELERLFRQEVAHRLEKPLNAELQQHPQVTLDDKRELCRWLNGQLRALSLAVCCPQTNLPAILVADPGSRPGGRFRWKVTMPDGTIQKPFGMHTSLEVALMPDVPRRESFAEYWADKSRQQRDRDSHKR